MKQHIKSMQIILGYDNKYHVEVIDADGTRASKIVADFDTAVLSGWNIACTFIDAHRPAPKTMIERARKALRRKT